MFVQHSIYFTLYDGAEDGAQRMAVVFHHAPHAAGCRSATSPFAKGAYWLVDDKDPQRSSLMTSVGPSSFSISRLHRCSGAYREMQSCGICGSSYKYGNVSSRYLGTQRVCI